MPGAHTKSLFPFSDDCGTEYLSRRRKREGHSVDFQCMMSEAESNADQCDSSPEQLNRKKKMLNDWRKEEERHPKMVQENLQVPGTRCEEQTARFEAARMISQAAPEREMGIPYGSDLEDHTGICEEPQCYMADAESINSSEPDAQTSAIAALQLKLKEFEQLLVADQKQFEKVSATNATILSLGYNAHPDITQQMTAITLRIGSTSLEIQRLQRVINLKLNETQLSRPVVNPPTQVPDVVMTNSSTSSETAGSESQCCPAVAFKAMSFVQLVGIKQTKYRGSHAFVICLPVRTISDEPEVIILLVDCAAHQTEKLKLLTTHPKCLLLVKESPETFVTSEVAANSIRMRPNEEVQDVTSIMELLQQPFAKIRHQPQGKPFF